MTLTVVTVGCTFLTKNYELRIKNDSFFVSHNS